MFIRKSTYERQLQDIIDLQADELKKLKSQLKKELRKEIDFVRQEMLMISEYQDTMLTEIGGDIYFLKKEDDKIKRILVASDTKDLKIHRGDAFPIDYIETPAGNLLSFYIGYMTQYMATIPRLVKYIVDEESCSVIKISN